MSENDYKKTFLHFPRPSSIWIKNLAANKKQLPLCALSMKRLTLLKKKSVAFDVKYENQSGKIWLMNAMQHPIIQTYSRDGSGSYFSYCVRMIFRFYAPKNSSIIKYHALYIFPQLLFFQFLLPFSVFFVWGKKSCIFKGSHKWCECVRVHKSLLIENWKHTMYNLSTKAAGICLFYMRR